MSRTRTAVSPGTPRPAATSKGVSAGFGAQLDSTAYSAALPPVAWPKTALPTWTPVTPSPTSSTTPAASTPGTVGAAGERPVRPLTIFQSIGLTPAARTAMRTWPGPACGSATSWTDRTSAGGPDRV